MRLDRAVRLHLRKWFGPAVDSWKMLGAYTLARALPQQRHAEWEQAPVRVGGTGGVYMCGDYRETASIQGALASGRRAAEAVIKDLDEDLGAGPARFDAGDGVCGKINYSCEVARLDTPQ